MNEEGQREGGRERMSKEERGRQAEGGGEARFVVIKCANTTWAFLDRTKRGWRGKGLGRDLFLCGLCGLPVCVCGCVYAGKGGTN